MCNWKSGMIIPGLLNEISCMILSMVPFSHHSRIKATCKCWRFVLSSHDFISSLRRRNHLISIFPHDPSITNPFLFDPLNLAWTPLPLSPCDPSLYGLSNFSVLHMGPHLYLIGGSLFDTRSFPINRPLSTSNAFRFTLIHFTWQPISPMISPRGSFACASTPQGKQGGIIVAGGGSRHTIFAAAGTRMTSVERYDVEMDKWEPLQPLPRFRAGCVGFMNGQKGKENEFWVVGGYGASRTISGVFPVDEYYRDGVVMEFNNGNNGNNGVWREVGDMWGHGQRVRSGKIVVAHDHDHHNHNQLFMLHKADIFRYDMPSNRWVYESRVPRKAPDSSPFGFVVVDRELYVLAHHCVDLTETRRSKQHKRAGTMYIQIYNPKKKTWRSLVTKSPFNYPIDISSAVLSSICL
ncbi:PREDICTED: F-box/kelch-repeat protein OR23 [Lupinus angustifolius]|uniref:F-box/kelch-repeat protein OR23 n=1 Tax=Lupinus angustifolius TaxID=3871 RepID=UPI00092F9C8A|nr:PREDICTED: F-box/kelch-repeat protein OR23 [Lupinus angustifolius]